jgi:predicted GTPase
VTGPVHGFGEPDTRVVAFTAAQIPHIADRVYPATLADVLAPHLTRWSAR